MNKSKWKIVTAMRHWSAADPSSVISCEYCTAHSTYTTSLVDDQGGAHEVRFHCDPHGDDAIALLESLQREGQRWVVEERHWMHIWKVGHKSCVSCRADSRFIATRLDDHGEIVVQDFYCKRHAPKATEQIERTGEVDDVVTDLTFRFGSSHRVTFDESGGMQINE